LLNAEPGGTVHVVTAGPHIANAAAQKNRLCSFIALFATFKFRNFTLEVTTYSKARYTYVCKHSGLCSAMSEQLRSAQPRVPLNRPHSGVMAALLCGTDIGVKDLGWHDLTDRA